MVEFVGSPQVDLTSTGVILTISDTVAPKPGRLPISDIKAMADLAATAVQPGALGSAAGANVEDFMLVTEHLAILAAFDARLAAIELGGGGYGFSALVPGVVEIGAVE